MAAVTLGEGTAQAAPRVTRTLASGLDTPWGIAFLPSGDALVTERDSGWISLVSRGGGVTRVRRLATRHVQESGLMGIALHPRFAEADEFRLVYAYLTTDRDNRVVRMTYLNGTLGDPEPILTGLVSNEFHNGGGLAFAPDGQHLFVSVGDAGHRDTAQSNVRRTGHILRVTLDGDPAPGNPWGNDNWTKGHRNVEGLAFAPNGDLWASEFGQDTWDELNHIVRGQNYGWPQSEGADGPGKSWDPLQQFRTDNCSPSGITVLDNRAWLGALHGKCLWSVVLYGPNRGRKTRYFHHQFGRLRAVKAAPDGSLWISTSNRDGRGNPGPTDDRILRVTIS
jgi:glucose/arabinose dehydrogenase